MIANAPDTTVDRRSITMALLVGGTCLLGMLLVANMLSGSGNSLAKMARALAVAGLISGFINPRLGIYLLVISTAYLDLFKRMLVLYDRPTMLDLYYVLGVAPLIMGGVVAGVIMGALIGRVELKKINILALLFAIGINAVVAIAAVREGGSLKAVSDIANDAFYAFLLFVIPVLFRSVEDFWKLIRFVLWVFVPVALYGIYQSFFGLSLFEIAYLKSGLTIMVKELDGLRPRPFSTLNSAGALAFACATLFVLSLLPWLVEKGKSPISKVRWVYGLLAVIFFAGTVASVARSAHIIWMISLPSLFFFSTVRRTVFFYAAATGGYLLLVINANWVLKMLPVWDSYMPKSLPFLVQLTRLQTFSERLQSFNQLKDPNTYSLFGLEHEIFFHDEITAAIVRHGVIPVLCLAIIASVILVKIHKSLLQLTTLTERRAAALLLGLSAATFAGGALVGGIFGTFPSNVYWWLMMSAVLMMTLARRRDSLDLAEEPDLSAASEEGVVPVQAPARRRGFPFGAGVGSTAATTLPSAAMGSQSQTAGS